MLTNCKHSKSLACSQCNSVRRSWQRCLTAFGFGINVSKNGSVLQYQFKCISFPLKKMNVILPKLFLSRFVAVKSYGIDLLLDIPTGVKNPKKRKEIKISAFPCLMRNLCCGYLQNGSPSTHFYLNSFTKEGSFSTVWDLRAGYLFWVCQQLLE